MSLQKLNPCKVERQNQVIFYIYQGMYLRLHDLAQLKRCFNVIFLIMEYIKKKTSNKAAKWKCYVIPLLSLLYIILEDNIMKKTNLKNINYPIIHEKIFHNESGYQRLQRSSKLIRCKESNVTNSNQRGYKMFQIAWI